MFIFASFNSCVVSRDCVGDFSNSCVVVKGFGMDSFGNAVGCVSVGCVFDAVLRGSVGWVAVDGSGLYISVGFIYGNLRIGWGEGGRIVLSSISEYEVHVKTNMSDSDGSCLCFLSKVGDGGPEIGPSESELISKISMV